ncbi:MAG: glycine dehydrogenase (aminomethyl-transferring), partial [Rhizobiaceae bacterium]
MSGERQFSDRHIGARGHDTDDMLAALGVPSLDALIDATVPSSIRLDRPLSLPPAASETEALAELGEILSQNRVLHSFIGQGYHGVFVPPVIQRNLFENPAWYTAYTPYQAEISQGRLEMLFHFQTLVTELTGLPVASASLLDEATAAAEAMALAVRHHRDQRKRIALAGPLHPQVVDVMRTRAEPLGLSIETGGADKATAAIFIPWPDTFG